MGRCCLALLMWIQVAPAAALTLFEAPTHLRFSAVEVSQAARSEGPAPPAAAARCRAACARIERVWARLLPVALQQPHDPAASLRLVIAAGGDSAYAHADGSIVFPAALAEALDLRDEEIAFILAHEIVHVLLEHEREILTAADLMLRPDVRRSAADIYAALRFDLGLSLKTSFLMQAAEYEADAYGLQLAALAGFDPERQLGALDKLLAARTDRAAVVATHPRDAERLQRLRAVLPVARAVSAARRGERGE